MLSIDSLRENVNEEDKLLLEKLIACGQEQVIKELNTVENAVEFIHEIRAFDTTYPGGLETYLAKCRDLLKKSSEGVNPFDGWTPSVPPVVDVEFNSKLFHELEKEGLEELTHCGFVLVAGGLGERLGYNDIKIGLPIETFTGLPYIGYYIKKILSIQKRSKNPKCRLPFAIMTSENNNERTIAFLKANHYFGMPESQITITMQECIPAVKNMEGEIAVDENGHIIKKPHGHGDVHFCLYRDHVIDKWMEEYDLNHIIFFQDTNTMNFVTMPCVSAVSARRHAHMVSTCVKRRPYEQTGGLCSLRHRNGDEMVCNVEYNQLEDVIRNTIDKRGDVEGKDGYSLFPGNCNCLCMEIHQYQKVCAFSHGIVPEFVNPKYKPGSKTEYVKPTRLESLMQDYPKLLLEASREMPVNRDCLVVTLPRFMAWSPVKNDYARAAALKAKTGFEESPRSGEADVQELFKRQILSLNDCPVCKEEGRRVVIEEDAHVCLWPCTGCTVEEIHGHFGKNVVIRKGSVFIVRCANWFLEDVEIDGCCVLGEEEEGEDVSLTLRHVVVRNKGWKYVPIDVNDERIPIVYRMRGYVVEKSEQCVFSASKPGIYAVEDKTFEGSACIRLGNESCCVCFNCKREPITTSDPVVKRLVE